MSQQDTQQDNQVQQPDKVDTFDLAPALLVMMNMLCSLMMMVFGIREWGAGRETGGSSDNHMLERLIM